MIVRVMLNFRDQRWVLVHGASRFTAMISTDTRRREDVFWWLTLEYCAGGAIWRRVPSWDRPTVRLDVDGFRGPANSWRELEGLSFWNLRPEEMGTVFNRPGGSLRVEFNEKAGSAPDISWIDDHVWRVAAREGRWCTVELAGLAEGHLLRDLLGTTPVAVTAGGETERAEPEAAFWKKNAELYAVENVPFGMVSVRVPRNCRDPESYAIGRAQELVGVPEPQHLEINDYAKKEVAGFTSHHSDLWVHLHFNGYYED
jgi:hypothetical protein